MCMREHFPSIINSVVIFAVVHRFTFSFVLLDSNKFPLSGEEALTLLHDTDALNKLKAWGYQPTEFVLESEPSTPTQHGQLFSGVCTNYCYYIVTQYSKGPLTEYSQVLLQLGNCFSRLLNERSKQH